MRYSPERKEAVLRKMMPPHNRTGQRGADLRGHIIQLATAGP